ncbi:MAG: hypothetical protein J0M02_06055 [Planctomycetes bacterium]|nr:hypothetical protein [Planctomycetota bacterium]
MRFLIPLLALVAASAADLPLAGAWAGDKPAIAPDSTVVLAMIDRNGTCCGGPAAALAGLGNLRTALASKPGIVLVEIDVTAGATAAQAVEAAKLHHVDGLPLLVDGERATAKALQVEIDMTMTYVVRKADGGQEVVFSPNQVKKKLGL